MKRIALTIAFCLAAVPVAAQDEDGFSLMDEGARLFLRGLMSEIEPTLDDLEGMARELEPAMRDLADQMGPALTLLMARIDDIRNYEAPVILDNGDILIRRSPDAPPYVRPPEEDGTPQDDADPDEEPADPIDL